MGRISAAAVAATLALLAAPAASLGAVVAYHEGVGLTYRASPGEVNHLWMNPFAGGIEGFATETMTLQDDTATLTQRGAFCLPQSPLRCPTTHVFAYMSDGDDYGLANPYTRDAYIWGQRGDDDVTASGRDHAVAYGGPGDDDVSAGADIDAQAWGQSGNDVIHAGTQNRYHLYGGGGDDDLTALTNTWGASVIDGGPGNDRISAPSAHCYCLEVLGQTGADTIEVDWARTIDGGANNDAITGHGPGVNGNKGHDRIDVSGNPGQPDVVTCGPGDDTVIADPDDTTAPDCETVTLAQ